MTHLRRWLTALGRPAVFAHRGASRAAPENSLKALRLAADLGADGVEFDVQRCGSRELVVFHDRSLARCTGAAGAVDEVTIEELRRMTLDRVAERHALGVRGERIPTLDEWLDAAPRGLFLNLEVKADDLARAEAAAACVQRLGAHGRLASTVISSFHPAAVAVARLQGTEVSLGALVEDGEGWRARLAAGLAAGAQAVHVPLTLVTPRRVTWWKRVGYVVATWTVDAPGDVLRCVDAGVDIIITNRPDTARALVDSTR